jgi:hypothetical protein
MDELLTTETIISNVYTEENDGDICSYAYGYKVYNNHPLAKIVDGKLFLDNYFIVDYIEAVFNSKIPSLYCVREVGTNYFVCGLDLMPNGDVWVGVGKRDDNEFKAIEQALSFVEEVSKCKCFICLEGEMSI